MGIPVYMRWGTSSDTPSVATPFPFQVSLEKEATFKEVYKSSNWKKKILMRLVKLFGYTPDLSFQKEDIDMKVVEQLMKHPDLLKAVDEWISDTNYSLLPQLREAKKVFEKIQRPPSRQALYRGFNINPGQQNSGIAERYKKIKPGDKWSFTPENPMSFSWHKGTTAAYGKIVVSASFNEIASRCLHITNEVTYATMKIDGWEHEDDLAIFTYAECVLLPDNKPIEFTLVSKG